MAAALNPDKLYAISNQCTKVHSHGQEYYFTHTSVGGTGSQLIESATSACAWRWTWHTPFGNLRFVKPTGFAKALRNTTMWAKIHITRKIEDSLLRNRWMELSYHNKIHRIHGLRFQ